MKANNIVRGFITCVTSLCLSGWSFASAANIVVTTNLDVVDPPFNASSLCGSGGTVADLPSAGSTVSLREAVIAANNTPGSKSITFAPSLSGTIVLTGPLYLCGGHTTLNGDVNGDETPDVTIDGAAVAFPFDVIGIVSSHNTVKNLRVLALQKNCPDRGSISITTTPAVATTVMDNTIAHNNVDCTIMVGAGFDEFHDGQSVDHVTIKHTRVQDNTVSGSPQFGILAFHQGNHNVMTDLTIAGNTVSGTEGRAIRVTGGWFGVSNNLTDVTIKDNLLTGNSVPPGDVAGIFITAGAHNDNLGAHNQVYAQLLNNTITDNNGLGIQAAASLVEGGADNSLTLQIRGNRVENNVGGGIVALGGVAGIGGQFDVTIKENTITGNSNPGDTAGIAILGGALSSPNNQVSAQLLNNTIANNNGNGISVGSGLDNSSDNDVEVTIRGNTLENNAGLGILTYGAIGAVDSPGASSGNRLNARIERNTVQNAWGFGLWVFGGLGSFDGAPDKIANGNAVSAIVTDNTITGTLFGDGMQLDAGGSGVANDNEVEVSVRKNTVCGSAAADIHAIGGLPSSTFPFLPDNTGTGNQLEGEISKNTASTIVVEDGVAGNVANVTQTKNVPCP